MVSITSRYFTTCEWCYWVLPHYFVHNVWTNFHSTPKQISLWPTFLKRRLRCPDQTYFEFVNSHSSLAYELYFAQPNTFIRGSMPEALRFDSNTAHLSIQKLGFPRITFCEFINQRLRNMRPPLRNLYLSFHFFEMSRILRMRKEGND